MTYKDILVHLDNSASLKGRLNAAATLAQDHQARLTGIFVSPENNIPGYISAQIDMDLRTKIADSQNKEVEHVKEIFLTTLKNNYLPGEWVHENGDEIDVLTKHARYADLLVIGQYDDSDPEILYLQEMPDRLILAAGRPVLVVPYIYKDNTFGKNIMVGWDASRTSTRAVHDALPILKKSDKTTIMSVKQSPEGLLNDQLPGADIAAHLSRHGVNAVADHITNTEMKPAMTLLASAADLSADMIVIGAYGHARFKELVMGGVTRHLLESMPVPVLLSH